MKRALVLNLTRFGDLLQTQPAIEGLAARGCEVGVVCLPPFAGAAALLDRVEAIFPFPGQKLLASLDREWPRALVQLREWRDEVFSSFSPDCVLNLTATLSGRLLARLLTENGAELLGFGVDEFGFSANSSLWATFLFASTMRRAASPYNLADLFRETARAADHVPRNALRPVPDDTRGMAEALLARCLPHDASPRLVAFQPGASSVSRQWPVERFAELGDMLHARLGLTPLLLGSPAETELGREYARLAKAPFADLIGRTSLPELAWTLRQCALLVTNDTGTMHLAAASGTPVLAIFLATAQPWDTGPYQAGCLCLEPALDCHPCDFNTLCPHARQGEAGSNACRFAIGAPTVFAQIEHWLRHGKWRRDLDSSTTRSWATCFDDARGHFADLASLDEHGQSARTAWIRAQRAFLRPFLAGESEALAHLPPLPEKLQETISPTARQARDLLHLLSEQGRALLEAPVPLMKKRFLATWERLQRIWTEKPEFAAIAHLWICETQEVAEDLPTVLAIARRYHALMEYLS